MGRAVAARLAEGGARLVVNDKREDLAQAVAASLETGGQEAVAVAGDVTSRVDVDRMVQTACERFGALHILVNNAGILFPTKLLDLEEAEWDLVIDVNMKGTYLCTRAALPGMIERGWGRIINFSSTAGKNVSTLGGPHYTAAKAGVLGLTRATAKEVARHGITCNAVCPGLIDTEMVQANVSPERLKRYLDGFPIDRIGQPWEVAELVAFLASDRAAYITGAALDINGGDLMV
jgi:NAD(P)-dependent dehydrogenase (short-subunit alcohol dehydrogenase family)